MNQISLDINKADQIINEPVVLRVGEKNQTITVNLLKDGQPYTSFTTATFFANKPSGSIVANDPANISNGVITYTVPQALVNEFGKITNAYFLIDGKTSTESFVIAVLQGVKISDDLNDYIPGVSNLNVIYDKWKAKLQTITDELAGIDAPKEVKNVIDNELKNYTDQINELQRRITALKTQLDALEVPVNAVGTNLYTNTKNLDNTASWYSLSSWTKTTDSYKGLAVLQATQDWGGLGQYIPVKKGDVITYSVYAKNISGTGTSAILWGFTGVTGYSSAISSGFVTNATITDSWQRVSGTAVANSDGYLSPRLNRTPGNTNTLQIAGIKVEKGTIATDWTPAPEDIVNVTDMRNSAVGTNLLLGTGNNLSITGTNSVNQSSNNYSLVNGYNVSSLALAFGTQFTISFDWSISGSSPSGSFHTQWNNSPWFDNNKLHIITVSSSNTSGHFSDTYGLSTDSENIATRLGFVLNNFVGTLTVSNVKLEKGTIATDWCPNPSEILTQSDYAKIKAAIVALGGALS